MKKVKTQAADDDMRPEYDFSGAVRGKYYERFQEGSAVSGRTAMLEVVRTSWFRWTFLVHEDRVRVAEIALTSWPLRNEKAFVRMEGRRLSVRRTRWFGREFVLEEEGRLIARAERPRVLDETLVIRDGARQYALVPGWNPRGGKDFQVKDGDRVLGSVSCKSTWLRRATVDLSTELSAEARMFVLSLALCNWRDSESAA